MATDSFLRLKGRTSYFRRKIPLLLQTQLASSEICFRLGVMDRDSAVLLARRLAVDVDAFFVSARRNAMLSSQDLTTLLRAAMATWHDSPLASPFPLDAPRKQAKKMAAFADELLHQQSDGFPVMDEAFIVDTFDRAGLTRPSDQITLQLAGHTLSAGMAAHYLRTAAALARNSIPNRGLFRLPVDGWEEKADRLLAPFGPQPPTSPAADGRPAPEVNSPPRGHSTSAPEPRDQSPSTPPPFLTKFEREAGPTFGTQAIFIVQERIKAKQVGPTAVDNIRPSLKLWLQICGDTDIREYSSQHMAEFRSVLIDLPQFYWRSSAERQKNILQILVEARASGPDYERITPQTINKHLSNMNGVFEYAKAARLLDRSTPNLAQGMHLESGYAVSGLDIHQERPGYTRDQVTMFFSHPVFTGRKSAYFYNAPGTVIIRDALYWLPVLACFQLMRREEICQLKVKHVRQLQGIWFFDLMRMDVRVKRGSSKRRVPVHDGVIGLGFIEQLIVGRDPEELLFPDLALDSRGSYSDAVGKRVGRMVDSLGIQLMRVDDSEADGACHPFRHFGITQLENLDVKSGIIDGLSGHASEERKSERKRYTDEIYLSVLQEAINRLVVPIDVAALNAAWENRSNTR